MSSGLSTSLGWPPIHQLAMVLGSTLCLALVTRYLVSRRLKPFTFRPPQNNRSLIWLVKKLLLPIMLRRGSRIAKVDVNELDLRRLRKLKNHRVVLTPNHSGGKEPYILFFLSKILEEEFNYLTAKEVFERLFPIGWLIQRLGAYSIVRGTVDKNSFRVTRQLLAEGKRWLVIFPEGAACGQNDTVMPFHQGTAQFAFWAYEDLAKKGKLPPLYFVPIAIKYVYLRDMHREIDRSLWRLERDLFPAQILQPSNLYHRLRSVGEAVLSVNEREHNVRPRKEASLDERVQHMKELIVSRVASALGVSPPADRPLRDRIRELFNAIDQIVYSEFEGPDYERKLHQMRQQEVRGLYDDLSRVLRFVALYDGYVRETLTAERFLDVLGLLEDEVFGRKRNWGPKKALVKVGEPLNLIQYYGRYKTDKRGTLQEVTAALESSVRQMLNELSFPTKPMQQGSDTITQLSP
jgi:1-acyl-sn-glycerol-3-phosphate acyltransferase